MTESPRRAEDDAEAGEAHDGASTTGGDESLSSDELIRRARSEVMSETDFESLSGTVEGQEADELPSVQAPVHAAPIPDALQNREYRHAEPRSAGAAGYRSAFSRGRFVQVLLAIWVAVASVAAA